MPEQAPKKTMIRKLLETEIPGMRRGKEYLDERLNKRIVEPLAKRGYGDVGAAIATIPSAAAELVLPDTVGEAAVSMLPVGKATGAAGKGGAQLLKKIQAKKAAVKQAKERADSLAAKKAYDEEFKALQADEKILKKRTKEEVDEIQRRVDESDEALFSDYWPVK